MIEKCKYCDKTYKVGDQRRTMCTNCLRKRHYVRKLLRLVKEGEFNPPCNNTKRS